MRRPIVALVVALVGIGLFVGGLAWLLDQPRPAANASRGARLFASLCATCHGSDGRGSWRAALFLIKPGDLTDRRQLSGETDRYLFDIIKHGGAPLGRPGMPGFSFQLSDEDIRVLVEYVRAFDRAR